MWNHFRVLSIATNDFPGWRGFAADPGLCCVTPWGYEYCGNLSHLAKLGTTEIGKKSRLVQSVLNALVFVADGHEFLAGQAEIQLPGEHGGLVRLRHRGSLVH